MKTHENASGIH